jgi:hypothetical protein
MISFFFQLFLGHWICHMVINYSPYELTYQFALRSLQGFQLILYIRLSFECLS